MQVSQPEGRPPYVEFVTQEEEDRDASIASGVYTTKDVDFAVITPPGSKDRIYKKVSEWFEQLQHQVQSGRFPAAWFREYKAAYKEWQEGNEIPLNGYAVKNWPTASPAQIRSLLAMNIRTVEDLAEANEETLQRLGMGGRTLKQQAQNWLLAAEQGKVTATLTALSERARVAEESLEEAKKQIQELRAAQGQSAPLRRPEVDRDDAVNSLTSL